MVATENCFSPSDLTQHIDMLLKESFRETSKYGWLKSRHIQPDVSKSKVELDKLKPIIEKMSSESCVKIAVKLDTLSNGMYSATAILSIFKKLLQEQHNIQLMEYNLKSGKDKKNKSNRVHPELTPEERVATPFLFCIYAYLLLSSRSLPPWRERVTWDYETRKFKLYIDTSHQPDLLH